jgi:hypothetical protein
VLSNLRTAALQDEREFMLTFDRLTGKAEPDTQD